MRLAGQEWDWDDGSLADLAIERLGEEQVRRLLEASSDLAVKRFRDCWQDNQQKKAEQHPNDSHKERMRATPVEEVIRAAEGESRCSWLRGWGMQANEGDLQTVLRRLWTAQDPGITANLLTVFSARPLPEFDARLIGLCHHADEEVRRRAFAALAQNTHSLVREFALTEARKGVRQGSVVALFIKNYCQGDEQRILEAMEFPDDECELHWLLLEAIKVLEKNPESDCSQLGVIAYASTPCEHCRFRAARLLVNQQVAPEWLEEECRYDSGEDCRALAAKASGGTGAS